MRTHVSPGGWSISRVAAWFAAVLVTLGVVAPLASADPTPVYYPLPTATHLTTTEGLTTDPQGNVWFGAKDDLTNANSAPKPPIGRFTLSQMTAGTANGLTLFRTPTYANPSCCATSVRALGFDASKNRIWFSRSDGLYGFAQTDALIAGSDQGFHAARTPGGVDLYSLAVNQKDSSVWIAENGSSNQTPSGQPSGYFPGNRMMKTDSTLGLHESVNIAQQAGESTLNSQRYPADPIGVSIDADGNAWFAENNTGIQGYRIARTSGTGYVETSLLCHGPPGCSGQSSGSGPIDVAATGDGSVWYINQITTGPAANTIGRYDPAAGTMAEYSLAALGAPGARPWRMQLAQDGALWVTLIGNNSNGLARVGPTPAGPTATFFSTGANVPFSVAPSSTGDVWFNVTSGPNGAAIGRLQGVIAGGTTPGGENPTTPLDPGTGILSPPVAQTPPAITQPPVVLAPVTMGVAKPATYKVQDDRLFANQICVGPPQDKCSLIYLLDAHEYVTGFPGSGASFKPKKKNKHPEIGRLEVTLNGGQTKKVEIKLNKKALKGLKKQGHIKAQLTVSQKQADGTLKVLQTKKVTFKKPKKK
jgi:streptogramin lyase